MSKTRRIVRIVAALVTVPVVFQMTCTATTLQNAFANSLGAAITTYANALSQDISDTIVDRM